MATKTSALLVVLAAFVAALALFAAPASAQEAPTVTDGGATVDFPAGIEFKMTAESTSPIEDVRLRYRVLPDGTAAIGRPDFEPGTSVSTTFQLEGNNPPEIYLSPGTVISYYWEVTDEAGNKATTEETSVFYNDTRFEWKTVEGDNITVRYYSGSEGDAQTMHNAAVEAISSMSGLLGANIDFEVQVWVYASTDDMRPALQKRSDSYDSQITTLGVRVASNTVLVLNTSDAIDTLRHELTHVVTAQAGDSALGSLPAWLDEGTAVYSQKDPGGFRTAVERAFDTGNVLSVREISSYPGDPAKVNLFYGEGWSLVSYLVDTYGEDQFAQLFAEVKSGKRIESALEAVYGFGQDGLEDEWRDAHDLPPRETTAPDNSDNPGSVTSNGDGGGTSTLLIIALAVGVIALAAGVGGLGILMAGKSR